MSRIGGEEGERERGGSNEERSPRAMREALKREKKRTEMPTSSTQEEVAPSFLLTFSLSTSPSSSSTALSFLFATFVLTIAVSNAQPNPFSFFLPERPASTIGRRSQFQGRPDELGKNRRKREKKLNRSDKVKIKANERHVVKGRRIKMADMGASWALASPV